MTLRAAAVLGISLAAATLLTGCYYQPSLAYAYYPPGCIPDAPPPANGAEPPPNAAPADAAPPPPATPCRLAPVYAYPPYPYYPYYPGYYAYPGYPYGYPSVSVGVGGRFRL
ncbi:MAG TPA: hypothetical protein VF930_05220 [Stellaceae bacterium]